MSLKSNASLSIYLLAALLVFLAPPATAHFPIPPKKGEVGRRAVSEAAPDFTLVDQEGRPFRFATARGKVVAATFIFTTCPEVCPLLTGKFAAIQREFEAKKRPDYLLLSITTDPETDTSSALKYYAERYKADPRRWLFLTGSREQLAKVWSGFGVSVQKSSNGMIQHTALTTLIDRQGIRRVDYYTDKWLEKDVLKDFDRLSSSRQR